MTRSVITTKQYVEQRDGGYWIISKRISLDSIVYEFLKGISPEAIVQAFPLLTLEQVYGAIAFYLANRNVIDAYLKEGEARFEASRQIAREANPLFYQRLAEIQKTW